MLGWDVLGGIVTVAPLAVAATASALGLVALGLAILAVIMRGLWKDATGR